MVQHRANVKLPKNALDRLLKRHGLTLDDLVSEKTETVLFGYSSLSERAILIQLYKLITQSASADGWQYKKKLGFDLTPAQKVDMTAQYAFYRRLFKREVERLTTAFLFNHQIYGPLNVERAEPMDQEELERLKTMAQGLSTDRYHRQLTEGDR
jgi:hypothetical protein